MAKKKKTVQPKRCDDGTFNIDMEAVSVTIASKILVQKAAEKTSADTDESQKPAEKPAKQSRKSETSSSSYLLEDLKKIKMLTPEESERLFEEVHSDDEVKSKAAANRICEGYLPYVFKIASRYHLNGTLLELGDLFTAGTMGLMKAIAKFDPSAGTKFTTYAYQFISGAISKVIGEAYYREIPAKLRPKVPALKLFIEESEKAPTLQEVADKLEVSPSVAAGLIIFCGHKLSFEDVFDSEPRLLEQISAFEDAAEKAEVSDKADAVMKACKTLTKRQYDIFMARTMDELSFDRIGELFGITGEGARLSYNAAKKKILEWLKEHRFFEGDE